MIITRKVPAGKAQSQVDAVFQHGPPLANHHVDEEVLQLGTEVGGRLAPRRCSISATRTQHVHSIKIYSNDIK
jgi:hypothetical protein